MATPKATMGYFCFLFYFSMLSFVVSSENMGAFTRVKRDLKDLYDKSGGSYAAGLFGVQLQGILKRMDKMESMLDNSLRNRSLGVGTNMEDLQTAVTQLSNNSKSNDKRLDDLTSTLEELESSLNTDSDYWGYSSRCTDTLVSQVGQIKFSRWGSLATSPCVWTIRTNLRSKIHLELVSATSSVTVTEVNIADDGSHSLNHKRIPTIGAKYIFKGPLILVSSIDSVTLTYSGYGKPVQNIDFHYEFWGSTITNGAYNFTGIRNATNNATDNERILFSTVVLRTDTSGLIEMNINRPKGCRNNSLNIFSVDEDNTVSTIATSSNNTEKVCDANTKRYSLATSFVSTYSKKVGQTEEIGLSWISRTNASSTSTTCGGFMTGKSGRVAYKRTSYLSQYQNNERCIWVIYPFPKKAIRFPAVVNGIEPTYDHLSVLEIDPGLNETTWRSTSLTSLTSSYIDFRGRVIIVMFYSDGSIVRNGFEFTWKAVGVSDWERDWDKESIERVYANRPLSLFPHRASVSLNGTHGFKFFTLENDGKDAAVLKANFTTRKTGGSGNCTTGKLTVITTRSGHLAKTDPYFVKSACADDESSLSTIGEDGTAMVFVEKPDPTFQFDITVNWSLDKPKLDPSISHDNCGGVLQGRTGKISYKVESVYNNAERCIWLIYSPTAADIMLRLGKEGFETCCDFILVNTIDPATGLMRNETGWLTRGNNTKLLAGTNLVILTFKSDQSVTGKGFFMDYESRGQKTYPHDFTLLHKTESISGGFQYNPEPGAENNILVLAYSGSGGLGDEDSAIILNASVSGVVLQSDEDCHSDYLNFYQSPTILGWLLGEGYPKLQCQRTESGCGNCLQRDIVKNDTSLHTFSTSYRAFVGIYVPLQALNRTSSTPRQRGPRFRLQWEASSGCGGIVYDKQGIIEYKPYSKYKNLELCIWILYIPDASKMTFLLTRNGFEQCCDYVILSSLDPRNGSLTSVERLRKDTIGWVEMDGPVVFVAFKSDGSVIGDGFTLRYNSTSRGDGSNSTITTNSTDSSIVDDLSSEPSFEFLPFHSRERDATFHYTSSSKSTDEGNPPTTIVALAYSPEQLRNETFRGLGSKINILPRPGLTLHVDNVTCSSDTLNFIQYYGNDYPILPANYYRADVPESELCTYSESAGDLDLSWTCGFCWSNKTLEQKLTSTTLYPGFVAIYKYSNRIKGPKQILFKWSDYRKDDDDHAHL